jgi:hypothetical protein
MDNAPGFAASAAFNSGCFSRSLDIACALGKQKKKESAAYASSLDETWLHQPPLTLSLSTRPLLCLRRLSLGRASCHGEHIRSRGLREIDHSSSSVAQPNPRQDDGLACFAVDEQSWWDFPSPLLPCRLVLILF